MARKKFELKFEGLEEMLEQFEDAGADVIPVATKALEATHAYITPLIKEKMQPSNLPAGGKYWTGQAESQIIEEPNIEWNGYEGSVDIGFSLDETIEPIFLINGTKNMDAVKGLKSTIYGKKTKNEIAKIQEEIFAEELSKVMNSGK